MTWCGSMPSFSLTSAGPMRFPVRVVVDLDAISDQREQVLVRAGNQDVLLGIAEVGSDQIIRRRRRDEIIPLKTINFPDRESVGFQRLPGQVNLVMQRGLCRRAVRFVGRVQRLFGTTSDESQQIAVCGCSAASSRTTAAVRWLV